MDFQTIQVMPWEYVLASQSLNNYQENHVRWSQSPDSHTFSVDLPGLRKEEIKVEIEDSIYLIIRTEATPMSPPDQPLKTFKRKFRLPESIDMIGISAGYEDGVLTVIVPKRIMTRRLIDPSDVPESLQLLARAA
ncbi:15.4 kDa class V heat shock protein [Arabidopsis thaliana]|uniref:15.4 kDa class V heat shock protein n=4 Tax=Arabidopsis TaxID=3701 RepID=HS154_ARATH|nr:HSP20-like chaperones superfamily protein [Arabidopsis thaliana]O49710.1 RecName: Full=15.4 kDa class V heat shock protein; AltName: Full=15.4 kDa heat shock protein; Short=AtHsp15.4 [Arabidopsis thaliana]KAG7616861.1 HSP20-like chaperone [Arabidopsis thaliana x Arabidopsis arenosa]KAG7621334.1 HSP20-like chaperone [Arabidopsis suecica]AAM64345.1 heat shock protein-like [Arabidopsis thaliana]ABF59020.1 At4g21870 [Arabidopsis thaliana]AEE84517.1 HSP20-like chaperones superfamily protein [Ar|eukprot:NP_193918.1 HSP20-like chaperones superfamily protein [Arabidopsis thaliana]